MKNLNYLLAVLFAVALLTTSCEKEEILPDETPTGITTNQLTGNWVFEYIKIGDETITDLALLSVNSYFWDVISLDITSSYQITVLDSITSVPFDWYYVLSDNVITINEKNDGGGDKGIFVFKIKNVEGFTETTPTLELELLSSTFSTAPVSGIYTLTR